MIDQCCNWENVFGGLGLVALYLGGLWLVVRVIRSAWR